MSKKIYVLVWMTESNDSGVDGYWSKPLSEEEQHAYFKKNYPCAYDVDGSCCISWEMVDLKRMKMLPGLPKCQWYTPA